MSLNHRSPLAIDKICSCQSAVQLPNSHRYTILLQSIYSAEQKFNQIILVELSCIATVQLDTEPHIVQCKCIESRDSSGIVAATSYAASASSTIPSVAAATNAGPIDTDRCPSHHHHQFQLQFDQSTTNATRSTQHEQFHGQCSNQCNSHIARIVVRSDAKQFDE